MHELMDTTIGLGDWLSNELKEVSEVLSSHLQSQHEAVNQVCSELAAYHGKMLRPSLLFMSWKAVQPEVETPKNVHVAASVVELIHLATLVHDDVLDESNLRRGEKTMNCLRGNEAAVMLGDYLLSGAFHLCSTMGDPSLNLLLGEVTNTICAGEMMQLYHRNDVDLDIDSYFQIIHDKTASLISVSCAIGGMLGGADEEAIETLSSFGTSVGLAFQIRDDLLDLLGEQRIIGKPTGRDLEKGKLTLPILLMLKENPDLQPAVLDAISNKDQHALRELLDSTNSIHHAFGEVERLVDSAITAMRDKFTSPASLQLCVLAEHLKSSL